MRFSDKVVLITGSGAGIGRAAALAFAREGAKVAVNSQSSASGAETLDLLKAAGFQALFVQGDVSCSDDARRLVEAAVAGFGRLDVLVNNAGIVLPGRVAIRSARTIGSALSRSTSRGLIWSRARRSEQCGRAAAG